MAAPEHTFDGVEALKNAAFNETAQAFEFTVSDDGETYTYASTDGALSEAVGREVLSTVLFAVLPSKSVELTADDGQTAVVLSHTTVPGSTPAPVNVSVQTNQFFNGFKFSYDTHVFLETSENSVFIAAAGTPARLLYAVKLGGPV
jgi:hypothetical protein